MTTAQSVTMTMADPKATETRLESLESTVQKLLLVQTTAEEKTTGDKMENSAADAVDASAPKEKDTEVEGAITCKHILDLKFVTAPHSIPTAIPVL